MFQIRSLATVIRTRITGIAGSILTVIVVAAPLTMVGTPSASAASFSCGGDVCAVVIHANGNVATIRAYPPNYTFNGHFELQMPNHKVANSISSTWHQNGTGNYFNNFNGGRGPWCVTAWRPAAGGGWENIGYSCVQA